MQKNFIMSQHNSIKAEYSTILDEINIFVFTN